jgi:hypothetical protein
MKFTYSQTVLLGWVYLKDIPIGASVTASMFWQKHNDKPTQYHCVPSVRYKRLNESRFNMNGQMRYLENMGYDRIYVIL